MNSHKDIFRNSFLSWGNFLKELKTLEDLLLCSIKFDSGKETFYLVPFTYMDLENLEKIELLQSWREKNQFAFPSRFPVTQQGTIKWLNKQVLSNGARVLFWVVNSKFKEIGHVGISIVGEGAELELDNVLRGVSGGKGVMSQAVHAIEKLVEEEFSLEFLTLRVLQSNSHAVDFYTKLGYHQINFTPLREVIEGDTVNLVPGTPSVDSFLGMSKNILSSQGIPEFILTAGPSILSRESKYVKDAVTQGWNSQSSDFLNKFESSFAEYVGSKYAMATSSCSGALHLALLALGIGPGDEVIVPDITWVATASAVMYTGATPIFADIDPLDWTISLDSIKSLITEKTKAIIPVHLYGFASAMKEIMMIAHDNNLFVVEDAAPAIGTEIEGTRVGTFGDFGCYSFQGAKLLVTGEGGMLVTNNEEYFKRAKKLQDHGRKPGTFWIEQLGYKYKMNNITAALGLAQIERADNQIYRKRRINTWYRENLSDLTSIRFQEESLGTKSICWLTSFSLLNESRVSRDQLIEILKVHKIDSRPTFPAISQYPIWGYDPQVQSVAKVIGEGGINLPSGVLISKAAVDKVCEVILRTLSK